MIQPIVLGYGNELLPKEQAFISNSEGHSGVDDINDDDENVEDDDGTIKQRDEDESTSSTSKQDEGDNLEKDDEKDESIEDYDQDNLDKDERIFNLLDSNTHQETCPKSSKHDSEHTVACPCGHHTASDYLKNMANAYRNHDPDLVRKCSQLTFPLKKSDPMECWPRMFIAPSYPTSGNALSRQIYSKVMNMNHFMDQYKEGLSFNMYQISYPKNLIRAISAHCQDKPKLNEYGRSLPIPMMGRAAIFKTHGPKSWRNINGFGKPNYSVPGGFLHGILRLARNPGDQIIRNIGRFYSTGISKDCYQSECFTEVGRKLCDRAIGYSKNWSNWHTYWNMNYNHTKQLVYHYEHFSHPDHVARATMQVVDFLNETLAVDLKSLQELIKPPSYKFGTIFVETCGLEYARDLHERTRVVSESLGYLFDYESGTWSLPDPK
jgi:hypothetical protein